MKLVQALQCFNRKERFWLIKKALGGKSETFDRKFINSLDGELSIKVPKNAWWAMDYHLDWLRESLMKTLEHDIINADRLKNGVSQSAEEEKCEKLIRRKVQDIDLILVFEDNATTHIILIEAKGVTGWKNRQLVSKANRLKDIFGEAGTYFEKVTPHFVTTSPTRPSDRVKTGKFPNWMKNDKGKLRWIPLSIPSDLEAEK